MFQWDTSTAVRNAEKHGVSFAEAATTFDDATAMDGPDVSHSFLEARRLHVGRSGARRILVVAYAVRGVAVRILSARLASRRERVTYAQAS